MKPTGKSMHAIPRFLGAARESIEQVRALLRFQREPLEVVLERQRQGGAVPFRMFGKRYLYLADPDDVEWMFRQRSDAMTKDVFLQQVRRLIGNGVLVSEGEFWRRQRGLMAHGFTPKRIRTYGEAMTVIAERFASRLADGDVVDIHEAMNRVTMAIVGKTLFDTDVSDKGSAVGHALEDIMEFFANSPEAVLDLPDWIPTRRMRRFVAARETVRGIIESIIRERRASGEDHGDLLSAMLASREEDGARMNDEQLVDECLTLFLAGHETTSLLLAHTFVLLSRHPEVAVRIRAEVKRVLGTRSATADDVKALEYTGAVLDEALRLYPSAWAVGREAARDLDLHGIPVPKGTQLITSQYAMHRDPRFYPDPESFRPERWTPEMRKTLPRGAFVPFGDGPRVCIGNHFAVLEAVLILVAVVRRADLQMLPGERLEFAPSVTLRAKKGVRMKVRLLGTPARAIEAPAA